MTQYTISQEAMARGAVSVDGATLEIRAQLDVLRAEIDTMLGGWRGDAATSFVRVHEAFEEQAQRLTAALARMHDTLVSTHRVYGNQEAVQSQLLAGFAARISG